MRKFEIRFHAHAEDYKIAINSAGTTVLLYQDISCRYLENIYTEDEANPFSFMERQ